MRITIAARTVIVGKLAVALATSGLSQFAYRCHPSSSTTASVVIVKSFAFGRVALQSSDPFGLDQFALPSFELKRWDRWGQSSFVINLGSRSRFALVAGRHPYRLP